MTMYPVYTNLEDEIIRTNYTEKGAAYCQNLMPRRTVDAVKSRARQLRIQLPEIVTVISDRTIIQRCRRDKSYEFVAKDLGITVDRVTRVMVAYRKSTITDSGALGLPPKEWEA